MAQRPNTPFSAPYEDIVSDFSARGIPTNSPGFFDHPAFLKIERDQPSYLNNYARFVQAQPYSEEYLARARREIPEIARLLHRELLADGRQGACIDLTMMLGKALNQEGFWNYQTKGGLTLSFPRTSGITPKYFWPADSHNPGTGHSWLVAPPFAVIDLTIKQQHHTEGAQYLPEYVLTEETDPVAGALDDVASPEIRASAVRRGIPLSAILTRLYPSIEPFWRVFPPQAFRFGELTLKYVATGVSAPDSPHDHPGAWKCNGRRAGQMYQEVILPHLRQFREAAGASRPAQ